MTLGKEGAATLGDATGTEGAEGGRAHASSPSNPSNPPYNQPDTHLCPLSSVLLENSLPQSSHPPDPDPAILPPLVQPGRLSLDPSLLRPATWTSLDTQRVTIHPNPQPPLPIPRQAAGFGKPLGEHKTSPTSLHLGSAWSALRYLGMGSVSESPVAPRPIIRRSLEIRFTDDPQVP